MRFVCNQTCVDSTLVKTYKKGFEYALTESEAKRLFDIGHLTKLLFDEKKYRFEPLDGEARAFQDDCLMGKFNTPEATKEVTPEATAEDTQEPETVKRGRKPKHDEEA